MPVLLAVTILLSVAIDSRWWIGAVFVFLPWPLNIVRLVLRERQKGLDAKLAWASGILLMVGKLPQIQGLIVYYMDRFLGRASRLVEYKGPKSA